MDLKIDTAGVRTAHTDTVNDKASQFVADLEDSLDGLSRPEQLQLFDRLTAVVGNKDAFSAFVAGTYAQDSTGAPAKALGAGSSTPSEEDARKAMATVLGAPSLPNGFKHLLRRAYDETAGDRIQFEDDGTPSEVVSLRKQVTDLTTERNAAKTALTDEQNDSKPGSLAKKLKDAEAKVASATPADMVTKADIRPILDDIKTKADGLSSSAASNKVKGKDELVTKVDEALAKVS